MTIEIISASPRQASATHRLVLFLQKHLQEKTHHDINVIDVRDWELPLLQQEVYKTEGIAPQALQPLAKRMLNADAFILVSPEYNGSYTSALKNLFDHFPKQPHKAFGIVTASTGALGGIRASQQMQLLINALFGIGSPYMLITPHVHERFNEAGNLLDAGFQKNIDVFIHEFLWLAENVAAQTKSIV